MRVLSGETLIAIFVRASCLGLNSLTWKKNRLWLHYTLTSSAVFRGQWEPISATGWLSWFKKLPLDVRFNLPDGSKVLAVHATPGTDGGTGIDLNTSDGEIVKLLADVDANLVLVGHTHLPLDRTVGNIRVVNPGSISNPFPPDLRASYAILEADENGYDISHRRVDYDREAVIKAVQEVNHPAVEYITRFMKGENKKDWMK